MKPSQRYMHCWIEDSYKFRIYQPLYFNKSFYHLKDFPDTTNILKQGSKVLHLIIFQIWGTNAPDHPELGLQSPSSQRWNTHFEQDPLQTWSLDWHKSVWSYNDKGFENSEKEIVQEPLRNKRQDVRSAGNGSVKVDIPALHQHGVEEDYHHGQHYCHGHSILDHSWLDNKKWGIVSLWTTFYTLNVGCLSFLCY